MKNKNTEFSPGLPQAIKDHIISKRQKRQRKNFKRSIKRRIRSDKATKAKRIKLRNLRKLLRIHKCREQYLHAALLAHDANLMLKYHDDGKQFNLHKQNRWVVQLYPNNKRIYCSKQYKFRPPHIKICAQTWDLINIVSEFIRCGAT